MNIPVIDDDTALRKIISDILIDPEYQAGNATNGKEDIELLKKYNWQYNSILADICMPEKNENGVAKYIKENFNLEI